MPEKQQSLRRALNEDFSISIGFAHNKFDEAAKEGLKEEALPQLTAKLAKIGMEMLAQFSPESPEWPKRVTIVAEVMQDCLRGRNAGFAMPNTLLNEVLIAMLQQQLDRPSTVGENIGKATTETEGAIGALHIE